MCVWCVCAADVVLLGKEGRISAARGISYAQHRLLPMPRSRDLPRVDGLGEAHDDWSHPDLLCVYRLRLRRGHTLAIHNFAHPHYSASSTSSRPSRYVRGCVRMQLVLCTEPRWCGGEGRRSSSSSTTRRRRRRRKVDVSNSIPEVLRAHSTYRVTHHTLHTNHTCHPHHTSRTAYTLYTHHTHGRVAAAMAADGS